MTERATSVNPNIVRWARERMGLSIEEVAKALGRPPEVILAWEEGRRAPTYRQLEKLAKAVYKRPVAIFFFPEPPHEEELRKEFRTIPEGEFDTLEPDTRFAIRMALARQQSLRELTGGANLSTHMITRDLSATSSDNPSELASRVRDYLGVALEIQQTWPNPHDAFKNWRTVIEGVGVFVFKRSFKQREISGFCLQNSDFPVIVINNSTSHSRQIFTLFHELAHLIYGISGITQDDMSYVEELSGVDHDLEVACNRFASEFLVPGQGFPWHRFRDNVRFEEVGDVANLYGVSREVILRRLLDRGMVDTETYRKLVHQWNQEFIQKQAEGNGGNYYATQATYLGDRYLQLAFSQYHSGDLSLSELASHLGVRARNLGQLEDFLLRRA